MWRLAHILAFALCGSAMVTVELTVTMLPGVSNSDRNDIILRTKEKFRSLGSVPKSIVITHRWTENATSSIFNPVTGVEEKRLKATLSLFLVEDSSYTFSDGTWYTDDWVQAVRLDTYFIDTEGSLGLPADFIEVSVPSRETVSYYDLDAALQAATDNTVYLPDHHVYIQTTIFKLKRNEFKLVGSARTVLDCSNKVCFRFENIADTSQKKFKVSLQGFTIINALFTEDDNANCLGSANFQSGGGVLCDNDHFDYIKLKSMKITNCSSITNGGAIYVSASFTKLEIEDSSFTHNKADLYGGVVFMYSSRASIMRAVFEDNAAYIGGAIYQVASPNSTIVQTDFLRNEAVVNGGAMDIRNGMFASCIECTFTANGATLGGAIYAESQYQLTMSITTFTENYVHVEASGLAPGSHKGGALALYFTKAQMDDCTFDRNFGLGSGGKGGAMFCSGGELVSTSLVFQQNSMQSGQAGALYSECNTRMSETQYFENKAATGGAVYINTEMALELHEDVFHTNQATMYGGAIFVAQLDIAEAPVFRGLTFKKNTAIRGGAMAMMHKCTPGATRCPLLCNLTFAENKATVGGALYWHVDNTDMPDPMQTPASQACTTTYQNNTALAYGNDRATQPRILRWNPAFKEDLRVATPSFQLAGMITTAGTEDFSYEALDFFRQRATTIGSIVNALDTLDCSGKSSETNGTADMEAELGLTFDHGVVHFGRTTLHGVPGSNTSAFTLLCSTQNTFGTGELDMAEASERKVHIDQCPAGYKNGKRECVICDRGSFQAQPNKDVCEICKPGRFSAHPGMLACTETEIGYSAQEGASAAVACTDGTAAPRPGMMMCVTCPINSRAKVVNMAGVGCFCREGYYQLFDSDLDVLETRAPTYMAGLTYARTMGFNWTCLKCHGSLDCSASNDTTFTGLFARNITHRIQPAYIADFSGLYGLPATLCVDTAQCKGAGVCDTGATGKMCSQCLPGYGRSGTYRCAPCSNKAALLVLGSLALIIVIFFMARGNITGAFVNKETHQIMIKIALSYFQYQSIASQMSFVWPGFLNAILEAQNTAGNAASSLFSFDCLITRNHWSQPSYVSFHYIKGIMIALLPLIFFLIFFLISRVAKLYYRHKGSEKPDEEAMVLLIVTMTCGFFLIHPTICTVAFQFFAFTHLSPTLAADGDTSTAFLKVDLAVQFYGSSHQAWMLLLGLPMILVWGIGVPVATFIFIYRQYRIGELDRNLADILGDHSKGAEEIAKEISLAQYQGIERFSFLFKGYETRTWWWEAVVVARKVSLIAIVVFFGDLVEVQVLLALLMVTLAMALHLLYQPFEDQVVDSLESTGLLVTYLTFFLGCMLNTNGVTSNVQVISSLVIVILAAGYLLYVAKELLRSFRKSSQLRNLMKKVGVADDDEEQEEPLQKPAGEASDVVVIDDTTSDVAVIDDTPTLTNKPKKSPTSHVAEAGAVMMVGVKTNFLA